MSLYERREYTREMNFMKIAMIFLFAAVFFFAYAVPALKDTYGSQRVVFTQTQ